MRVNNKAKVILHIGTEKTGTTSIQELLFRYNDKLKSRGIIACGDQITTNVINNFFLVTASKEYPGTDLINFRKTDYKTYRSKIMKRLADFIDTANDEGSHTFVFSSEHLSSRLTTIYDTNSLRTLFPEHCEFSIILYLRRQDELYLGAQAEAIKCGGKNVSFNDPRKRDDRSPYGIVYYDYEKMLLPWEHTYGESNITIRPYDKNILLNNDIIDDFLSILGCTKENIGFTGGNINLNKRLSPEMLWFLSRVNDQISTKARRRFLEILHKNDTYSNGILITNDVLKNFLYCFEESNKRVSKKYIGTDSLFDTTYTPSRFFDHHNKNNAEAVLIKVSCDIINTLLT